jgi:hypothetical protein
MIICLNLFKKSKYKDSFYSEDLVPLFFDTLNNVDVQKRKQRVSFSLTLMVVYLIKHRILSTIKLHCLLKYLISYLNIQ